MGSDTITAAQTLRRALEAQPLPGPRRTWMATAPARLEIMGGFAAEAGGAVAQMALPQRAATAVRQLHEPVVRISGVGQASAQCEIKIGELLDTSGAARAAAQGAAAGPGALTAAALLVCRGVLLLGSQWSREASGGFEVSFSAGTGKPGPAAAAAMVAAALQALSAAVGGMLELPEKTAVLEKAVAGVGGPGGGLALTDLLSALCAAEAPPAHILRYSTQPVRLVGQIALPEDVRVLALDNGAPAPAAAETARNLRRASAMGLRMVETVYRDLGQAHSPLHGYLVNLSPQLYRRYFRALLPRKLRGADFLRSFGPVSGLADPIDPGQVYQVRTAIDHLVAEHEHAEGFLQAMEELADPQHQIGWAHRQRTLQRAGRLLLASQHSYRLRLDLSWREADWLIDTLMTAGPRQGVYGARICPGGEGVVVALLDNSSKANDVLLDIMGTYRNITGTALGVAVAGAKGSGGACLEPEV